jgi:hypothetical protein
MSIRIRCTGASQEMATEIDKLGKLLWRDCDGQWRWGVNFFGINTQSCWCRGKQHCWTKYVVNRPFFASAAYLLTHASSGPT